MCHEKIPGLGYFFLLCFSLSANVLQMCDSIATDLLSGETGLVFVLYLSSDKDIESSVYR